MSPPRAQHSLRSKIFLRFTLLVGLTLIATGTFSLLIVRSIIEERTRADLLSLAEERGQNITQLIDANRNLTRLLSLDEGIRAALRTDSYTMNGADGLPSVRTRLLHRTETVPSLENIALLSTEGRIRIATDSRLEGADFSSLPHFTRGTQATFVGPLHITLAKRTYLVSTPVRGTGSELIGVLIAEFGFSALYDALTGAERLGDTGGFLLQEPEAHGALCFNPRQSVFSMQGALLSAALGPPSPRLRGAGQPETGSSVRLRSDERGPARPSRSDGQGTYSLLCSLAAAGRGAGILLGEDETGRSVIAAHALLRETGLGLIAKVETREIYRPVRALVAVLAGTTGILLLLVTFIALRLSRDIVDPILRLRTSLQQLNTGHWAHERSIFTRDELEVLDRETARLAARLKEAYSSLEMRVRERTEELAAEHAKDEALLESIAEGFFAADMTGEITTSNRSAEEMLKWTKGQMIGANVSAILNLHTKQGEPIAPNGHVVRRAIEERTTVRTLPTDAYECERRDGSRFPVSITAMPFLIGMEMKGVVVTFRDVTEERRIDRMKSEFISLASHQLRTPLTAIGWYVELLTQEERRLTDDQRDYIRQILDSHKRMVDLVNSLLNVSRIELGRLKIEPRETGVEDVVEPVVLELQPQMERKRLKFTERLPKGTRAVIDVDLVGMVIENLLSNAVKYTPEEGSIELSVMTDGKEMQFRVRDTGVGIPKAQQHKIFEKLFRADNVQKTDTDGTGIGLYIAKYTTEAWGGRLWFESEEGKGTTFTFTVPLTMKKVETENGSGNGRM